MIPKPAVDYRHFRLRRLKAPEYSHIRLLLFWPIFGFLFALVERGGLPVTYHAVSSPLDAYIPFCEWFLFPYLYWFLFLSGGLVYGFFFDIPAFRRTMWFTIVTYSVTMVIYFLYPTCQELRPTTFVRSNVLIRFIQAFYRFDTNTNVCPSIHVLGSVAIAAGLWDSDRFRSRGQRVLLCLQCTLICASTVFMKQHSIVDVLAALLLCVLGCLFINSSFFEKFSNKPIESNSKRVYNSY